MKYFWVFLLFCFSNACSTSATVKMAEGTVYSGKIVDADSENIYIEARRNAREFGLAQEGVTALKKVDIVTIDHPGNVHFLIGGILTGVGTFYGGVGLAIWASSEPNDGFGQFFFYQMVFASAIYMGVGLPMAVWGWSTWDESKSLAERDEPPLGIEPRPKILFLPLTQDQQASASDGLNIKWGFSLQASF